MTDELGPFGAEWTTWVCHRCKVEKPGSEVVGWMGLFGKEIIAVGVNGAEVDGVSIKHKGRLVLCDTCSHEFEEWMRSGQPKPTL